MRARAGLFVLAQRVRAGASLASSRRHWLCARSTTTMPFSSATSSSSMARSPSPGTFSAATPAIANFGAGAFFAAGAYATVALNKALGLPLVACLVCGRFRRRRARPADGRVDAAAARRLFRDLDALALGRSADAGPELALCRRVGRRLSAAAEVDPAVRELYRISLFADAGDRRRRRRSSRPRSSVRRSASASTTIRDDEIAAEALGVPTLRLKLAAATISGAIMGVAGAPLPFYNSYVNPESAFALGYTSMRWRCRSSAACRTGSGLSSARCCSARRNSSRSPSSRPRPVRWSSALSSWRLSRSRPAGSWVSSAAAEEEARIHEPRRCCGSIAWASASADSSRCRACPSMSRRANVSASSGRTDQARAPSSIASAAPFLPMTGPSRLGARRSTALSPHRRADSGSRARFNCRARSRASPFSRTSRSRSGFSVTPAHRRWSGRATGLEARGLADKAQRRPRELTQVDLRRLELARALACRPKLLDRRRSDGGAVARGGRRDPGIVVSRQFGRGRGHLDRTYHARGDGFRRAPRRVRQPDARSPTRPTAEVLRMKAVEAAYLGE